MTSLTTRSLLLFSFAILMALPAHAGILFEGWSKVLISSQHVGYVVQRYEFDEKKKEFRATHFLKTSPDSGGLTESLVARSDASFKPLAYQYTSVTNGKPTTIDASFKGDKMTALVTEGKEKKTITNTMPKGSFLTAFLAYVMLGGKEGLKKGVKYEYQGVLEESAIVAKGDAFIAEEENVSGIPAFRILNTINGAKFISLSTHKGEVLGTVSPSVGVQTVLVASMEEAVAGFGVNSAALTQLFGSMPKGKENEVSRRGLLPTAKPSPGVKAAQGSATATIGTPAAGGSPATNIAPPAAMTPPLQPPSINPPPATPAPATGK